MQENAPPNISILLPTYNGEQYLGEQLDSILAQTHPDFELLIMDDGSTDQTTEIAARYAHQDKRVIFLPSEGNRGQKMRLLELLGHARGTLIAISDQDDIWHEAKLERLFNKLGESALAFGRSELIDGEGRSLNRSLLDHLGPPPQKEDRLSLFFKPQVSGHAMLARREVITEMAFRRFHHYDWLISLEAMFSTGITYVDDAIVYHRIHGGNQINSNRADLGKLLPQSIGWALNWSTRRRFHFLERLEHVGCSPLVAEPARVAFHRLGMQCRSAWFDKGNCKSISPGSLRKLLCISLKPYSGSENDWKVTVHNIDSLMHARFHPQTLYCLSKEILKIFRRDSTGLGK